MLPFILVLMIAVAVIFFLASRQSDEFRVTRSAFISAPPATVFAHVGDLEKWHTWSPWARMDPDARNAFDGPTKGVGARMSWQGKKTGQGSMTITESRPNEFVRFRLEFVKPFKATNTAEFIFAMEGNSTRVTWTMYGPNQFIGKVISIFKDCSSMVGSQFEEGLSYLNEVVTTKPQKAA